jgi:hypothetical protein
VAETKTTKRSETAKRSESSKRSEASKKAEMVKGARITGPSRDKLGADLKKKYESGKSVRDLAETTGRSYGFVHRMLVESGADMRGRGGATRGKAKMTGRGAKKS